MANKCDSESRSLSPDDSPENNYTNEQLEMYVLNETNKPITKKFIESVLKKYGITHKVGNLERFQTAMIHTSYLARDFKNDRLVKLVREKDLIPIPEAEKNRAMPLCNVSYERLEFLGDSVIHLVLAEYLHDRYPDEQEGFMTRLRTKIESGTTLAHLSKVLGLHEYVVIARNIEQIGGREKNTHILEDCFEAFIGSCFIDANFELCRKLLINLIEENVDFSTLIHVETNHKDTLLQWYHKWKWPDPEYGSRGAVEKDNKKIFIMYVKGYMQNSKGEREWVVMGEGSGTSKKKGEQEAARNALIKLGIIRENIDKEEYIDETDFNYE
ncbi:ribonuclease III [Catovirus CTV1]|uniref:Ribonuclease III n=1 Tax=Catovirus CTV1 TaxID=1977631 RepID=A0A1V0SC60_9VIRU|nr:ribonuclease III [Catovirus CTV1]